MRTLTAEQLARLETLRAGITEHWQKMGALQEEAARIIGGRSERQRERARDFICEWAGDEYPGHRNPSVSETIDQIGGVTTLAMCDTPKESADARTGGATS